MYRTPVGALCLTGSLFIIFGYSEQDGFRRYTIEAATNLRNKISEFLWLNNIGQPPCLAKMARIFLNHVLNYSFLKNVM